MLSSVSGGWRRGLTLAAAGAALAVAVSLGAATAAQEEVDVGSDGAAGIRERLRQARPDLPVETVEPAPIEGFHAVALTDGTVLYVTPDGEHLFAGDLYRIGEDRLINRTETRRAAQRAAVLDEVATDDMIVFSPDGRTRSVINVFTDVDCGFCQRLHQEVPALNEMGIEVRYLAYPRAGIGSPSYDKVVSAWCAEDPNRALTRLKAGQPVEPRSCPNPVASQYRLGQRLGIRGTPAMFLEDGSYIPGYLPADELAARMGVDAGS